MPDIAAATSGTHDMGLQAVGGKPFTEVWVMIDGPGPVHIEVETATGYKRAPEWSFYGTTSRIVRIPRRKMRFVIEASAPTAIHYELA